MPEVDAMHARIEDGMIRAATSAIGSGQNPVPSHVEYFLRSGRDLRALAQARLDALHTGEHSEAEAAATQLSFLQATNST